MNEFKTKIIAELDTAQLEQQLKNLNNRKHKINLSSGNAQQDINDITKNISNTTKTAKSFGNTLKDALNIGSTAAVASKVINLITTAAKNAFEAVKGIDDAIKDLRMATSYTYEETSKLVSGYNQKLYKLEKNAITSYN